MEEINGLLVSVINVSFFWINTALAGATAFMLLRVLKIRQKQGKRNNYHGVAVIWCLAYFILHWLFELSKSTTSVPQDFEITWRLLHFMAIGGMFSYSALFLKENNWVLDKSKRV